MWTQGLRVKSQDRNDLFKVEVIIVCNICNVGAFTPYLFGSAKMNSGLCARLVQFVWAGVKDVNENLAKNLPVSQLDV